MDGRLLLFANGSRPASPLNGTETNHTIFSFSTSEPFSITSPVDLVAQHNRLRRGAAGPHVLVRAADVGGNHFENDPVLDLATARVLHFRIVDFLYFDLASAEIHHTTIARHAFTSLLFLWNRVAQTGSALSARVIACWFCVVCYGLIAGNQRPRFGWIEIL